MTDLVPFMTQGNPHDIENKSWGGDAGEGGAQRSSTEGEDMIPMAGISSRVTRGWRWGSARRRC